jgi:two-component system alkaline phosphatase synthesis response regulator PhoP
VSRSNSAYLVLTSSSAIRVGEVTIPLPRKEFELAQMLMERHGRIVQRETLLERIWGINWGDSKTLDQHIRRLRRRFEKVPGAPQIETIRRVGYRLEA